MESNFLAISALFLLYIHFGKSLWFTWIPCNEASACRVSTVKQRQQHHFSDSDIRAKVANIGRTMTRHQYLENTKKRSYSNLKKGTVNNITLLLLLLLFIYLFIYFILKQLYWQSTKDCYYYYYYFICICTGKDLFKLKQVLCEWLCIFNTSALSSGAGTLMGDHPGTPRAVGYTRCARHTEKPRPQIDRVC